MNNNHSIFCIKMGISQQAKKRLSTLLIAMMFLAISVGMPLLSIPAPASAQEPAGNPQWMHRGLIAYNGIYFYDNDTTDAVYHYDSKDSKFGGCTASIQFDLVGSQVFANRFFYDGGSKASTAKYIEPQAATDATGARDCGRTTTRDVTLSDVGKRRITFIRLDDNTIIHYKNGATFKKSPGNARMFVREGDSAKCKDLIYLREAVASNSDGPFTKGQTQSGSSILYAVGDASNNDGDGYGYHSESYGDVINNAELKDTKKCGMVFSDIYNAGAYALVHKWDSSFEEDLVDGFFSYGVNSQSDVYSLPPKNDDAFIVYVGDTSSFPVNPSTGQPVTGNPQGSEQVRPSCDLGTYGWLLCNLVAGSEFALKATEGFIFPLLGLQPLNVTDLDSPLFKVWSGLRDIVNVGFIGFFLFIALSQATSIGIKNYGIKKKLPLFFVTLLLANLSYFIWAFFTDLSNIGSAGFLNLVEGAVGGDINVSSMPLPTNINVPNVTLPVLGTGGGILAILIKAKGFAVFVVPIIFLVLGAILAGMLLGVRIALINIGAMISAVIFLLLLINQSMFYKIMNFFGMLWMIGPGVALAFGAAHITSFLLLKTLGG